MLPDIFLPLYSSLALSYCFLMDTADSPAFCHSNLFFSTLIDSLLRNAIVKSSAFHLWIL